MSNTTFFHTTHPLTSFCYAAAFLASIAAQTIAPANKIFAQEITEVKIVDSSSLPSGQGLAARFIADENIHSHTDVMFADGFEAGQLGAGWDETRNDDGEVLFSQPNTDSKDLLGKQCIKVVATLDKNTGGGFTKWFPSSDRLFIRFYTKFDPQCDYVHHFCTLRANRSLVGADRWSGFGGAGLLPDGKRRFSTAIEPWGNGFRPAEQPNIEKDKWICVEFMLLHNTPGVNDGEQAYWIDGQLRGHWKGFNWRTDANLQANALTLESYITDRWTKQEANIVYFDNVVIAKSYIGPAGSNEK